MSAVELSVEQAVRTDGPEAGTRVIRITSGDLQLDVLPDRGLDLGQLRVAGIPLAFMSGVGFPRWSNDGEGAFARAFGGGILATCGLRSFGPAGEGQPMHGRVGSLPAQVTRAGARDDAVVVEGIVRETALFEEPLELHRRIEVPAGLRTVRLADSIVNRGSAPTELMTLYHVNFGAPLVGEGTVLHTGALEVHPRDAAAAAGIGSWGTFPELSHPYPEQVFVHELPPAQLVEATVTAASGVSATLRWNSTELPGLLQWRVADPAWCVLGVEPCDTPTTGGRADARANGILRLLEPGHTVTRTLELEVRLPSSYAQPGTPSPSA